MVLFESIIGVISYVNIILYVKDYKLPVDSDKSYNGIFAGQSFRGVFVCGHHALFRNLLIACVYC